MVEVATQVEETVVDTVVVDTVEEAMDTWAWIVAELLTTGIIALAWGLRRRGWIDLNPRRIRRGVGNAALGLQDFVQPSIEYVIQAENTEQADRDDHECGDARRPIPRPFRPRP